MQSKKNLKLLIIIVCFAVAIATAIFVVPKISSIKPQNNNDNNIVDDSPNITPTITCESEITIELLDSYELNYTVNNLQNYYVSVLVVDENILSINNNMLQPIKIGNTKIIIQIDCTPAVTKEISVNVIDCVKTVEFSITDSEDVLVDNIYTNTIYHLHITQNIAPSQNPEILCSMPNFNLLSNNDNEFVFAFELENAGNFTFTYNGKYVSLTKTYTCLTLPSTINVGFNNVTVTNNQITIYLFDNNYKNLANENGVFDYTTFTINKINILDDIEYSFVGESIQIDNNTIYAITKGTSILSFVHNITSIKKISYSVTIIVEEIELNKILLNNEQIDINSQLTINYYDDNTFNICFNKYPCYAFYDFDIVYDDDFVTYQNNTFNILNNANTTIELKYHNETVLTLNFVYTPQQQNIVTHNISINQKENCNVAIDDNNKIIDVTISNVDDYCFFSINIVCYINNVLSQDKDYSAEFDNQSVCNFSSYSVIYFGVLSIQVLGSGTCNITITNNTYDIEFVVLVTVA